MIHGFQMCLVFLLAYRIVKVFNELRLSLTIRQCWLYFSPNVLFWKVTKGEGCNIYADTIPPFVVIFICTTSLNAVTFLKIICFYRVSISSSVWLGKCVRSISYFWCIQTQEPGSFSSTASRKALFPDYVATHLPSFGQMCKPHAISFANLSASIFISLSISYQSMSPFINPLINPHTFSEKIPTRQIFTFPRAQEHPSLLPNSPSRPHLSRRSHFHLQAYVSSHTDWRFVFGKRSTCS